MKKSLYISVAALAALFATSCSDFLETAPTSDVASEQVFTSVKGAQAALNGCYYYFNFGSVYGGRGDDNGYITHLMTIDSRGEDVICDGGWYNFDYQFLEGYRRGDSWKNYSMWFFYYNLINNLNSVITYTPQIEGGDPDGINSIMGQAYALRGWSYFMLAQFFQQTYTSAVKNNLPGVPIYTEPTSAATEGKPRGTIQETFDQILSDLTEAEKCLASFERVSKHHIDKQVVEGMLAHVYLVMNDWPKAREYARLGREGYPMTSNEEWKLGFNNLETPSWIWGVKQDKENQWLATGDYSPFAQWANKITRGSSDEFWSFNGFWSPEDFVNLFEESDIRYERFILDASGVWTSGKFYDNLERTANFPYMRTEDLLLVEAEAAAQMDDFDAAGELLRSLQTLRGASTSTAIKDDLIEEILLERRKELYGEGYASFDIIRSHKGLERTGDHASHSGNQVQPAGSWNFIYQIPVTEITNNPNIDSQEWPAGDQNPFNTVLENL